MNKKEFTKQCLADSFVSMLRVKPFNKITVEDIVRKSGFSRMSYYRNFATIEEVAEYYLSVKTKALIEKEKINIGNVANKECAAALYAYLLKGRDIIDLYIKQDLVLALRKQFITFVESQSKNINNKYVISFVVGGLYNILIEWAKNGYKETPEELADILSKYNICNIGE